MRLLVRADGSATIGLGHVMRSLAYAEEARERGASVEFVITDDPVAIALPRERGFAVTAINHPGDLNWLASEQAGVVVLVDGYRFEPQTLTAIAAGGARLAVMDQVPGSEAAALVVAPDGAGDPPRDEPAGGRLLSGVAYAPVRREFRARRRSRRDGGGPLLVTMGGSDPTGLTAAVVAAVLRAGNPFPRISVVVGPAATVAGLQGLAGVDVYVAPPDVAAIFDASSAAISAAGTTAIELLCMGVPSAMVEVNDTQAEIGRWVAATGAGRYLGRGHDALAGIPAAIEALGSADRRGDLSAAALRAVDGRGAERVVTALEALAAG